MLLLINEQERGKTYKISFVPSEDSDQPAQSDQSLLSTWRKYWSFATHRVPSGKLWSECVEVQLEYKVKRRESLFFSYSSISVAAESKDSFRRGKKKTFSHWMVWAAVVTSPSIAMYLVLNTICNTYWNIPKEGMSQCPPKKECLSSAVCKDGVLAMLGNINTSTTA